MEFEWERDKAAHNLAKHRISFERALYAFQGPILAKRDNRKNYGEVRWAALGRLSDGTMVFLAYMRRGDRIRLISVRKANRRERKVYQDAFGK